MVPLGHHAVMFALILIPVVALVALAIYAYGADSRVDDVARRRGFNS
jgi:hypothetical protein